MAEWWQTKLGLFRGLSILRVPRPGKPLVAMPAEDFQELRLRVRALEREVQRSRECKACEEREAQRAHDRLFVEIQKEKR